MCTNLRYIVDHRSHGRHKSGEKVTWAKEMGRLGEVEGRRVENKTMLVVKDLAADSGGGRHPDSGFSDSSDSSVVVEEEETEVKVVKRRGEKERGKEEKEEGRTVRRRGEKDGAVGGLSVSFYSVTDMIRDRSLQLDINSNLFSKECLTTSFMTADEGEQQQEKIERPKIGRSNPVPAHLRGLPEVGGKNSLGDLDGMDCPLQAWLEGPHGCGRGGGGGPVDSWLGEVRGVQEAECSTMLQSKPIRLLIKIIRQPLSSCHV